MKKKDFIGKIIELHEWDNNVELYGSRCGYYTEGWVNKQQFAIVCNKEFNLACLESPVCLHEVKQGYLNRVDFEDGGFYVYPVIYEDGFPATYVFW